MNFFYNKVAGAVLGTALGVFGLSTLSHMIYSSPVPTGEEGAAKPGYMIAVAETPAGGGEAAAPVADESIGARLAKADKVKGEALHKPCAACHDFTKGGPNKVGPNLYDVVERGIAGHEGFAYSEAFKGKSADKWTYENLDVFLKSPKAFVPGTKMAFAGIAKAQDRADVIAYLAGLSDAPKPFPAP